MNAAVDQPEIDYEDAAEIGFKVAEMADRVKVAHAVVPGSQALWHFTADDVRFQVVVTVDDSKPEGSRP